MGDFVGLKDWETEEDLRRIEEIVSGYTLKMEDWKEKGISLKKQGEKALIISFYELSRYSTQGRKRIGRKVLRRLSGWNCPGVMGSFTYAPRRISKVEAWAGVSGDISRVLKNLNQQRRDRGKKTFEYFWCIEVQKGTGYPHVHIFCPGILRLADQKEVSRIWGRGFVSLNPRNWGSYVIKYLVKGVGWKEEGLALLWKSRIRLYGYTQGLGEKAVRAREYVSEGRWWTEADGKYIFAELFDRRFWRKYRFRLEDWLMGQEEFCGL